MRKVNPSTMRGPRRCLKPDAPACGPFARCATLPTLVSLARQTSVRRRHPSLTRVVQAQAVRGCRCLDAGVDAEFGEDVR
jgi:hypothetical protein